MEKVDLKLFTVSELRNWLIHNQAVRGLSEALISKQRAYAIVTNPNAKDDMPVVSALFVNDDVAAYTACFPDVLERPKGMQVQWCTTLYVNPKYEGRGYAYIVLQQLIEVYGDTFFDLDAAEASQANIRYTGLKIDYINQYIINKKAVKTSWLLPRRLKTIYVRRTIRYAIDNTLANLRRLQYTLEYTTFMDDVTYDFVASHSEKDLFLRSQESFTWMLQHGLRLESPCGQKVRIQTEFSENKSVYRIYGVRVIINNKIVGFYILRNSTDDLSVKYLYYKPQYQKQVFASITEHLILMDNYSFVTHHKPLADFVAGVDSMYGELHTRNIAFSHPVSFVYDAQQIQGGDGDMLI